MNESSLSPNQAAVYGVLAADATLLSLCGVVLDAIPEPTKYRKYVVIGESVETPMDTFGQYGNEEVLTIHTVVEDTQDVGGWKTAKDIDARIVELLDGQALTVSGRSFIYCNRDQAQSISDPPWRHIARDFRIATEGP